jgi:PAS domain S-box-containing protein
MVHKTAVLGRPSGQSVAKPRVDDALDHWRLFQATPAPVIVVDHATLHVVAVNAAATRAFGWSEDEFLARSLPDLVSPEDRKVLLGLPEPAPVPGLLEARSSWQVLRRDGKALRTEVAGSSVLFAGRACAILHQPAQAEPDAKDIGQSGAASPEFSFTALHDLKEPLHLIKGYLSLLRAHAGGLDPEAHEYLEYAYGGAERMQAIVLGLLEFFRVDAKGIAPEPLDLGEAVGQAVAGLRLQVQEAQATITHDPLPRVMADRVQVGRLLENLLSNALKFRGADPPRVHVGAGIAGNLCDLWVRDNGIGIDPKDQDRVLQPFQRIHSSDRYPGTGLGLSICRKIAELHGGHLWIESTLGHGTTIHVTLPLLEA